MSMEGFVIPPLENTDDGNETTAKFTRTSIKASFGHPLPKHYENIFHLFVSMEKVVSVSYNRNSRITFDAVARNVIKNTKRSFTQDHFARMLHVYPQSYKAQWEKRRQTNSKLAGSSRNIDLVLTPNLQDDFFNNNLAACKTTSGKSNERRLCAHNLVSPVKLISPIKKRAERDFVRKSPMKAPVAPIPRPAIVDPGPRMDGRRLTDRKMLFRHLLVLRVKEKHEEFLAEKNLTLAKDDILHPDFDIETCPPIPPGALPDMPKTMTPLRSAYDYFKAVPQKKTPENKEAKPPLNENLLKTPPKSSLQAIKSGGSCGTSKTPKLSLLERLRAKQAAKASMDMSKIKRLEKRLEMLEHLNSKMLEVICGHFRLKSCHSMNVRTLMGLVGLACGDMNFDVFMEHIEVLCDASDGLCVKALLRGDTFLKITEIREDKIRIRLEDSVKCTQQELKAALTTKI